MILPHVLDQFPWSARIAERGLGLGLSLVKAVVEAHGGTVSVDSLVGRGSTFTVSLNPSNPSNLSNSSVSV